jgi:hypothetical protein
MFTLSLPSNERRVQFTEPQPSKDRRETRTGIQTDVRELGSADITSIDLGKEEMAVRL